MRSVQSVVESQDAAESSNRTGDLSSDIQAIGESKERVEFSRRRTPALQGPPISEMSIIFNLSRWQMCTLGRSLLWTLKKALSWAHKLNMLTLAGYEYLLNANKVTEMLLDNFSLHCDPAWERQSCHMAWSLEFPSGNFSLLLRFTFSSEWYLSLKHAAPDPL